MPIPVNTRIRLGVSKPKKDAIVAQPGTPATASEIAIWAAGTVPPELTQSLIGDFWKLFRMAKSNMPVIAASVADPVIIWMPLGGSDNDVSIGGSPTSDTLRLEIGSETAAGSKSHFLDRTFKRLLERWLEESK